MIYYTTLDRARKEVNVWNFRHDSCFGYCSSRIQAQWFGAKRKCFTWNIMCLRDDFSLKTKTWFCSKMFHVKHFCRNRSCTPDLIRVSWCSTWNILLKFELWSWMNTKFFCFTWNISPKSESHSRIVTNFSCFTWNII